MKIDAKQTKIDLVKTFRPKKEWDETTHAHIQDERKGIMQATRPWTDHNI